MNIDASIRKGSGCRRCRTLIAHQRLGAVIVLQELPNLAFPRRTMSYREAVVGGEIDATFWNEHPDVFTSR
jgi:hypothetical protein